MSADLYDNEWRKAYDNIVKTPAQDKKATDRLLDVLKECYKCCLSLSRECLERINTLLQIPPNLFKDVNLQDVECDKYVYNTSPIEVKMIKDIRIMIGAIIVKKLTMRFKEERPRYYEGVEDELIRQYMFKCVELCWLVCVHETPLLFKTEFPQGSKIDKSMAISYSKKGNTIKYVVWPALLSQNGDVLARAIVQTN